MLGRRHKDGNFTLEVGLSDGKIRFSGETRRLTRFGLLKASVVVSSDLNVDHRVRLLLSSLYSHFSCSQSFQVLKAPRELSLFNFPNLGKSLVDTFPNVNQIIYYVCVINN